MMIFFFLWIYLIAKGHFDEIHQKYLVPGHSFLSCDRDFAQIEKKKRVEKCEVPLDLVRMIVTATPKNPFIVSVMQPEDFFDFKAAAEKNLVTTQLQISKVQWINVTKDNLKVIKTCGTLNEMDAWKFTKVF